ncbi:MAG: aggregation factor core, partial [Pseudomonadota bacterium]
MLRGLSLVLAMAATPAVADLRIEFDEGAPKDRMIFENVGACIQQDFQVTIDLTDSSGKLIFDTSGAGAGVEVFQPFETEAGADALKALPAVTDGQKVVTLNFAALAPGQELIITSDLDDTIGAREITVSGSEFEGTTVTVDFEGGSN